MNAADILSNAKRFQASRRGLTRAQELKWFGETLGVEEVRLLRLLGYSPQSLRGRGVAGESLVKLAELKPEQTLWVTELFRELADRTGYDVGQMKVLLRPVEAIRPSPPLPIVGSAGPDSYRSFLNYLRSPAVVSK
ncbi:MAG: hypothetical protein ACRC7O_14310, partial [Fimbriiglobus sp.]